MAGSVLITGGSGFLGANLCKAMADAGWTVYAGSRRPSGSDRLAILCPEAERHVLDLTKNAEAITDAVMRLSPDVIIHCAAYGVDFREDNPAQAVAVNVQGAAALVAAAAATNVTRVVHIGTSNEYGFANGLISELTPLNPSGIYGSTKAAGLLVARERARTLAVPFVAARVFGMYGPLEGEHKFVPHVMRAARTGASVELTAGEQVRDYTYVGDVAQACVLMASGAGQNLDVINLASGRPVTLREMGEAAAQAGGGHASLLWGSTPYRPGEPMSVRVDPAMARHALGWEASTSLADGMTLTAHYEMLRSTTQ